MFSIFARQKPAHRAPTVQAGILDAYCMQPPGPQQVLDIVRGEWSSAMPAESGLPPQPGRAPTEAGQRW